MIFNYDGWMSITRDDELVPREDPWSRENLKSWGYPDDMLDMVNPTQITEANIAAAAAFDAARKYKPPVWDTDDEPEFVVEGDEDLINLTDEANSQIDTLYSIYEKEIFGFYRFREFWDEHPSNHPNYFLKAETHTDSRNGDALFLKQLEDAQVPWSKQHTYHNHERLKITQRTVAAILHQHAKSEFFWVELYKECRHTAAHDRASVYTDTIKEAVSLVYTLHTKDSLYKMGRERTWYKQMKGLCDELKELWGKNIPIFQACGEIAQITADKDRYSLVTEGDVARLLSLYTPTGTFFSPFPEQGDDDSLKDEVEKDEYKDDDPLKDEVEKDEYKGQPLGYVFDDITKAAMEMDPSSSALQADVYTRMLMRFFRGPTLAEQIRIVKNSILKVDDHALVKLLVDNPEKIISHAYDIFGMVCYGEIKKVKQSLYDVVNPLFVLNTPGPRYLSSEIPEIVEVAELRRMALGSRFIGRSHLLWAFCELGFGLPKTRKPIDFSSTDEDHPPYHIYVAAMKLAVFYKAKKLRLEHFIFAVLFAQDNVFDGSEDPSSEMRLDFEDFMKDIALGKTEVEPKSSLNPGPDSRDTEESCITTIDSKSSKGTNSGSCTQESCITTDEPKSSVGSNSGSGDTNESTNTLGQKPRNADWCAFMDTLEE